MVLPEFLFLVRVYYLVSGVISYSDESNVIYKKTPMSPSIVWKIYELMSWIIH